MYRACIFCSAKLGSNDSIERFPVGRSLAFDASKGRLWAVCPKCARWNMAPIEERWEAVEDAERRFRDARTRVHRENIGLAKLADGTRLVRVGQALPGEVAACRYGRTLFRRQARQMWAGGAAVAVVLVGGLGFGAVGLPPTLSLLLLGGGGCAWGWFQENRVVQRVRVLPDAPHGELLPVRLGDLTDAELVLPDDGEPGIRLPRLLKRTENKRYGGRIYPLERPVPFTVTGVPARTLMARAMVYANGMGGDLYHVNLALRQIADAGSPQVLLRNAAEAGRPLFPRAGGFSEAIASLTLEIALHDETERRALEGELAMLEAMWRDAEGIAAIADRLPDVDAQPPRLPAER